MSAGASVTDAITRGAALLRAAGIDNPRLEARLLLAHATGMPPATVLRDRDCRVEPGRYEALLARRAAHEPLAYIIGHREFWSLDFAVSPATLVPRPESETLIDAARVALAGKPPCRILDLGTGTGCLLLAALHEFPAAFGVGVDRSAAALAVARDNAVSLGLADRSALLCADWTAALAGRFHLILSNPPYIRSGDIDRLQPEIAGFEPRAALDGGPDGLAAYRRLIPLLPSILTPDGVAILELGAGQAGDVAELARAAGLDATTRPDLAGIPRASVLRGTPSAKKPFGTAGRGD